MLRLGSLRNSDSVKASNLQDIHHISSSIHLHDVGNTDNRNIPFSAQLQL